MRKCGNRGVNWKFWFKNIETYLLIFINCFEKKFPYFSVLFRNGNGQNARSSSKPDATIPILQQSHNFILDPSREQNFALVIKTSSQRIKKTIYAWNRNSRKNVVVFFCLFVSLIHGPCRRNFAILIKKYFPYRNIACKLSSLLCGIAYGQVCQRQQKFLSV